jgi:hemerythrin
MAIEWTPDLAVGNEEIDGQHRELFRRANALLDAMVEGRAADEIERTLDFLSGYVGEHFRAEERQMALLAYPAAPAHRAEHGSFVAQMLALRDQFRAGGVDLALTLGLERLVCGWLGRHFVRADQALATFLRRHADP